MKTENHYNNRKFDNKGVSLAEVMVTVFIIVAASGILFSSFSTGNSSWRTHEIKMTSQREGRKALQTMAKEIRQASVVNSPSAGNSASQITFTRPSIGTINYTWSSIGANANKILSDSTETPPVIASDISNLTFTNNTDSVTINLTATSTSSMGEEVNFNLEQKVALR